MEASIKGRTTIVMIMLIAFVIVGVFSNMAKAQVPVAYNYQHATGEVKNAAKDIAHSNEVNLTAKATPLNTSINSPYAELKPALAPSGKRIYFSRSEHPDNTFGTADLEDIWFADFDSATNSWSHPAVLVGHLNNAGPNYINNVSRSGDTVILGNQYLKKGKMRAGLSYSVRMNGEWSQPENINIKDDYNISDHSNTYVSIGSGVIIRAVQRSETYGDRDLYVSFWDGTSATEPINMGSVINSEFEEAAPFLDPDNKTLYFASKGHHGYGGFDIWVSKRLDDTWTNWSEPRNLGPAVNGRLDDSFFSITHCGNFAIFSKQVSVHNTDLFRISVEELFNQESPRIQSIVKLREEKKREMYSALAGL
jgi:OOP family OmpA-OmpF porin